jgi:hypothetical protein
MWHSTGVFVEIRDTAGVKMAKTLMPQETELITGDVPKVILLVIGWGKQELLKSWSRMGDRSRVGTGSGSGHRAMVTSRCRAGSGGWTLNWGQEQKGNQDRVEGRNWGRECSGHK